MNHLDLSFLVSVAWVAGSRRAGEFLLFKRPYTPICLHHPVFLRIFFHTEYGGGCEATASSGGAKAVFSW